MPSFVSQWEKSIYPLNSQNAWCGTFMSSSLVFVISDFIISPLVTCELTEGKPKCIKES